MARRNRWFRVPSPSRLKENIIIIAPVFMLLGVWLISLDGGWGDYGALLLAFGVACSISAGVITLIVRVTKRLARGSR